VSGTQADTIWDLAEGFAILARNAATMPLYCGDAAALHAISMRLKVKLRRRIEQQPLRGWEVLSIG
jgi:short-subunit dehydrogenase involved in D-alanine esterification of teichoic acids